MLEICLNEPWILAFYRAYPDRNDAGPLLDAWGDWGLNRAGLIGAVQWHYNLTV